MTGDAPNIEWVVAEVMRRLNSLAARPADARPADARPADARPADGPSRSRESGVTAAQETTSDRQRGDLTLDSRLVTLATIDGQMKGVRRVLVATGTVVTPAVKDELRKRRVRLEFQDAADSLQPKAASLLVARCTRSPESVRAASRLPVPAGADGQLFAGLTPALSVLVPHVADARQVAVLLTDDPLTALCLANRSTAARASMARHADDVRAAIATIGANLLIVDPCDVAEHEWNEMVDTFRQGLPRRCPPSLRSRPG